jgi:hypothetical protein
MATAPITGIELIDRELERHAPFNSSDEAEALAAKLVAVWRLMQPGSEHSSMLRSRPRRR